MLADRLTARRKRAEDVSHADKAVAHITNRWVDRTTVTLAAEHSTVRQQSLGGH